MPPKEKVCLVNGSHHKATTAAKHFPAHPSTDRALGSSRGMTGGGPRKDELRALHKKKHCSLKEEPPRKRDSQEQAEEAGHSGMASNPGTWETEAGGSL